MRDTWLGRNWFNALVAAFGIVVLFVGVEEHSYRAEVWGAMMVWISLKD